MSQPIDVTVAAVIEAHDRYLLVEELVGGRPVFNQPAGHVEAGEAVIDAVVRETREETGYWFQPKALIGIYTWQPHPTGPSFIRFCFTGPADPPDGAVELDDGIIGPCWLTVSEMEARQAQLRSPLVMRAVDDYARGIRYPLDCFSHLQPDIPTIVRAAG